MFPRDMVCLRNISVDTLHKGDTDGDDDDDNNNKVKFLLSTPRRHIRGVEVWLHSIVTSAVDGGEWFTSRFVRFTPGKEPRYSLNRRLGGPKSRSGRFEEGKNHMY